MSAILTNYHLHELLKGAALCSLRRVLQFPQAVHLSDGDRRLSVRPSAIHRADCSIDCFWDSPLSVVGIQDFIERFSGFSVCCRGCEFDATLAEPI